MGTTGQSITLANSIIGVGILAMPFCYQQCGVILATLILLFMGLVSRLCCYFLLKSALMARRRNFEFLGFHVFGPAGKMAVEVGIIGFLMGTCIAYFVVVGDLGPQIIAKMFNINQSDILRTSIMVIVSLVCVLPLGLLRNVDSLSSVSAVTIGFYFCLVMKVITEATSQLWAGEWHSQVAMWKPAGLLQCVPIFSMALFCQTQLFEIFESMPSLSLEKMNLVTKNAINICTGVYFTLGLFGYIAFSSHTISGNILMSLSPTMASDVIKLGFVMSVACSFPLIIFPCRASLYSFLYKKVHSTHHDHLIHNNIPEATFRCITVAIIAVALFISLLIPNIELVLGLVGSTIGVLICVVFPAACFVNVTFKNTNERILAKGVIVLGLVIMVLGTYANLQAAENQVDRYDEKYITQERIDKIVEDFFESKKLEKSSNYDPLPGHLVGNGHDEQKVLDKALKVVIKDSEVQPPNPEPPETHSNENDDKKETIVKQEEVPKENMAKVNEVKDKNDSHPRNLKSKLNSESGQINGAAEINSQLEENVQKDNFEKEKKKQEEEIIKHAEKIQARIDMLKHEKLIETMKQHGEEQKELLEEQKEILHEIEKKKEEIEQSKKDADSNEAKKIAVESIQKIALKAIESLGGVSDKPIQSEAKNPEPIEAVQQIAKHAVDSIVAIQDAGKDKPGQANEAMNAQKVVNVESNKEVPVQNSINVQNIQNSQVNGQNSANIVPEANNANNNAIKEANINEVPLIQQPNIVGHNVGNPAQMPAKVDAVLQQIIHQEIVKAEEPKLEPKDHSHSPDEPQSYKQGEDLQKQQNNNEKPVNIQEIVQNVPLPLALMANLEKGNEKLTNQVNKDSNSNPNLNNNNNNVNLPQQKQPIENKVPKSLDNNINNLPNTIVNQVANNIINNNNGVPNVPIKSAEVNQNPAQEEAQHRQKREVVDCTEKTALKPEDKRICERLLPVAPVKITQESDLNDLGLLSSKVDLNDHVNRLPMETNVIHRSLKSVDEPNS